MLVHALFVHAFFPEHSVELLRFEVLEGIFLVAGMLYFHLFRLFFGNTDIFHIGAFRNEDNIVTVALLSNLPVVLGKLSRKVVFCCEVFKSDVFVHA